MFELNRLPEELPVFPLTGAVLLPKAHLPLNIFEERYLDMIYYAREKNGLIGMIQPALSPQQARQGDDLFGTAPRNRPLYQTGCVGMISDFVEVEDAPVSIMLTGLSRFDIVEEITSGQTFRQVRVCYDRFREDCALPFRSDDIDRQKLVLMVEKFLKVFNIIPKWELLEKACDEELINALAIICPFDPAEKQALIEEPGLRGRLDLMIKIMEFYLSAGPEGLDDKILQ